MTQHKINAIATFLLLTALPVSAFAHTGIGAFHSFADGFSHPWLGLDHLLAMVAVGLWATGSGGRHLWLLPGAFLSAMAAGALLNFAGLTLIGAEIGVAFSLLALGLLLALHGAIAMLPAMVLVAVLALGHGYVHAAEIGSDIEIWPYALGFLAATATLHGVGLLAGLTGPVALKIVRAVFAVICTLTGAALLAGV